jgi:hypothetical protein
MVPFGAVTMRVWLWRRGSGPSLFRPRCFSPRPIGVLFGLWLCASSFLAPPPCPRVVRPVQLLRPGCSARVRLSARRLVAGPCRCSLPVLPSLPLPRPAVLRPCFRSCSGPVRLRFFGLFSVFFSFFLLRRVPFFVTMP